jgi:uncharacterized membrane protein YebE (DUF533 family)
MELTKKERKIAREIIEIGLKKEFSNGLLEADKVLNDWKNNSMNNHDAYHLLCQKIKNFDKHIARRYDGMTGSKYVYIVVAQLADGLISEEELEKFSEEVRLKIKFMAGL